MTLCEQQQGAQAWACTAEASGEASGSVAAAHATHQQYLSAFVAAHARCDVWMAVYQGCCGMEYTKDTDGNDTVPVVNGVWG